VVGRKLERFSKWGGSLWSAWMGWDGMVTSLLRCTYELGVRRSSLLHRVPPTALVIWITTRKVFGFSASSALLALLAVLLN